MRSALATMTVLWFALAASTAPADETVDYAKQIKPIFSARCYSCHGALKQKNKLRTDSVKSLIEGGDSGPVIEPGKSDESLLVDLITEAGKGRMPPPGDGEALSAEQIALIKTWIDQGAVAPPDDSREPDPRDHWAFRAPLRPSVPSIDAARRGNPIDAFLAAGWKAKGLTPQPPALKGLLQRRVYLDLTGVPPTAEDQAAFLADDSPDAYEAMVDRLLASKHYAERWGRHWMDIWRYSDWWGLGAELRNSQKHIWHWRDWIIESLDADKGYDQMVREMIAADELTPNDPERLRATGFLARNYFKFNRNTWLEEVVEHTGKAFLGLTFNCAKCHDHKYDPISHNDYYRLRAFFEPYQVRTDQVPGELDFEKGGIPRAFDSNLDAPTYRFERGNEAHPLKDQPLQPGIPALLAWADLEIKPVTLPVEASRPGLRPFVLEDQLRAANTRVVTAQAALAKARDQLAAVEASEASDSLPPGVKLVAVDSPTYKGGTPLAQAKAAVALAEKALATALAQPEALQTRAAADRARHRQSPAEDAKALAIKAAHAERQEALAKAEEELARLELQVDAKAKDVEAKRKKHEAATTALAAARKAFEVESEEYTPLRGAVKAAESPTDTGAPNVLTFPTTSTGRRTALANWLTDRKNPLTARVAVNHIWARHFGKPLVSTVFDFGRKGAPPTHPELLDWLAIDFMEHGWSMKRLHRLIVRSDAYRRSSSSAGADPATLAADPENRLYWRMNPVRMEAQVVRDSLFHLAGELSDQWGGPPVPQTEAMSPRRSLYFVHSHNDHNKFLSTFDDASVQDCYRRGESVVPVQALALWNSRLSLTMAAKIANRLNSRLGEPSDAKFATEAFRMILGTPPTADELSACEQALTDLQTQLEKRGATNPGRRAREILVQSLLNHNDFITIR